MPLRIAVLSDLHVFEGSSEAPGAPSYVGTADGQDLPEKQAFTGLATLIAAEELTADLVLCAGDIGNQAAPGPLRYGWERLYGVAAQLGDAKLLATSGNHDVDSRYKHDDADPRLALQSLRPLFPGVDEQGCDQFWARNFTIWQNEVVRVAILNSAAFHGGGRTQEAEFERGRVSGRTIAALKGALTNPPPLVNILLCHHHPLRFNSLEEEDYSEMLGGENLLELLGSGDFGNWIIIHGHKHFPKLMYGPGTTASPVIFSAGSFSVVLYPRLAQRVSNQFYFLEIPHEQFGSLRLDVAGVIRAWDWTPLVGWHPAGPNSGLPQVSGFGWREATVAIAEDISNLITAGHSVLSGEELARRMPKLTYLLPDDLRLVIDHLQRAYGISVSVTDGRIQELGRK